MEFQNERRLNFVVNLSCGEYFVYNSNEEEMRELLLKKLLKKLDKNSALIKEDIGESRWKKSDNIKIIPASNKNLKNYVKKNMSYVFYY